jgi:hypothetical protein
MTKPQYLPRKQGPNAEYSFTALAYPLTSPAAQNIQIFVPRCP